MLDLTGVRQADVDALILLAQVLKRDVNNPDQSGLAALHVSSVHEQHVANSICAGLGAVGGGAVAAKVNALL